MDVALKILFFFVVYGTANEIFGLYLRYVLEAKNTMLPGNIYYLLEFIFLGYYYRQLLKDRFKPWIFVAIVFAFVTVSLSNLVVFNSWHEYPALLQTISKIFFIGFCLLYFYKVMDDAKIQNLWKEPTIYINVAILIYYAGNLFFSLMFNLILEYSRAFSRLTVLYFSILNALFYVLIAMGFWQVNNEKSGQSSKKDKIGQSEQKVNFVS